MAKEVSESTSRSAESRLQELLDLHPPFQITILANNYTIDTFHVDSITAFPDGLEIVTREYDEALVTRRELYVQGRNTVFRF